jgi:hypothetical protein
MVRWRDELQRYEVKKIVKGLFKIEYFKPFPIVQKLAQRDGRTQRPETKTKRYVAIVRSVQTPDTYVNRTVCFCKKWCNLSVNRTQFAQFDIIWPGVFGV